MCVCYALIRKELYSVQIAFVCWLEESLYRVYSVQGYINKNFPILCCI